jgi:tRNA A37 threonylcarbamoyladenosine dehydratase
VLRLYSAAFMATQTIALSALKLSKSPTPPVEVAQVAAAAAEEVETSYRLHRRFDRMGRLVGDRGMARLFGSHVMVIGLGGVGSWAAESLVRSGVGRISLVDFDLICVTNANRQLHAMRGTTGRPKVEVMAERLRLVNPACEVRAIRAFYEESSSASILGGSPDLVIDAIDNLTAKTHLIASCRARALPLVVSGGASGRMDPTRIREADLTRTSHDPFLSATRKLLRKNHGFPHADKLPWHIPTVYSARAARRAARARLRQAARASAASVLKDRHTSSLGCMHRNVIYGTAELRHRRLRPRLRRRGDARVDRRAERALTRSFVRPWARGPLVEAALRGQVR